LKEGVQEAVAPARDVENILTDWIVNAAWQMRRLPVLDVILPNEPTEVLESKG
jgi:hypothetical protein